MFTLLVLDNTGDPIEKRIRRAAQRFEEKYGKKPNVCHVNPIMIDEGTMVQGIDVIADSNVRPDRFVVGVRTSL